MLKTDGDQPAHRAGRTPRAPGSRRSRAALRGGATALVLLTSACAFGSDGAAASPTSDDGLVDVPARQFNVTSGRAVALDAVVLQTDSGGMRGELPAPPASITQSASLSFTYEGPSREIAPLANGEVRSQIGLKLRAQDTCNVVYVMWHVAPSHGVFVSVKRNPDARTHADCGAGGYINVRPSTSVQGAAPPMIRAGEAHVLRADLDGRHLRVRADGELAWDGELPSASMEIDGPIGVRTDNGTFRFSLRIPQERERSSPRSVAAPSASASKAATSDTPRR